jgi:FAD/FMN-containing dehydrogenase
MPEMLEATATRTSSALRDLGRGFTGGIHPPSSPAYEVLRRPIDPALDPRPVAVAEALDESDVARAIVAAREHDLPFAVQATGHGTRVAADGGIVLNTGRMSSVLVDPDRRVAVVGPGARWGAVVGAAAQVGLAPVSGSAPDVGVVGFTLGGGVGWLSRKHGFAADGVLRAELVTADGDLVTASAAENPDLHWAIRGGGGNFGVVTSLEFKLHPVTTVYAGAALFSVDRAAATLAVYRDWIDEAPDELSTAVLVTVAPETPELPASLRGRRVLAIKAMFAGEPDEAERHLRPLRSAAGVALHDDIRPVAYGRAAMGGTPPRQLTLVGDLGDEAIDAIVHDTEDEDSPVSTVEVRHWGGAMASAGPLAGPVGHRDVPLSVIADAPYPPLASALAPGSTGGAFLNFLADTARTRDAYTAADYARLRELKRGLDPDNFFRVGHNIPPAG